jgi:hypothetical protein
MTKTTLKALWVGGGGLLATWLAVTPQGSVPAGAPTNAVQRQGMTAQQPDDDLTTLTDRLRERANAPGLSGSPRNPFRFNSPRPSDASGTKMAEPAVEEPLPAAPPPPPLKLSGVSHQGGQRTAIISIENQIYFVKDGDSVAGRYKVVTVDPEAVLLRDDAGNDVRLVLPE